MKDEKWHEPVYKKLAASELGAGHTGGIVPTRETQDYFGISDKMESHLIKKINVEFWCGDEKQDLETNLMFYYSETHNGHIHITENLLPVYLKYGAQLGDILVFWKSKKDENKFIAELIKPGSERWDEIELSEDENFPKAGGFLKLLPPK